MLQVGLRELARGPVETRAELAGDDPLLEGLEVVLADPVRVAGRLQSAGAGRFYWRGSLSTPAAGGGRRCLPSGAPPPAAGIRALLSPAPDATEDPSSYPPARDAARLELRPAV